MKTVALVSVLWLCLSSAQAFDGNFIHSPSDYSQFFYYIARGEFKFADPNPALPNCENGGGFCFTDSFFTEVMQYTPEQIAIEEARAKAWYRDRFGIDVDDPNNQDRVRFFRWTADTRTNFRAYFISDREVPQAGYQVRDGGFAIMITDPDGFDLGGDFSGHHVADGATALYGNYNILITDRDGQPQDEINLYYRADTMLTPLVPSGPPNGIFAASCQLSTDNFADSNPNGFIRIIAEMNLTPEGLFQITTRHSLTVGGHGDRLF